MLHTKIQYLSDALSDAAFFSVLRWSHACPQFEAPHKTNVVFVSAGSGDLLNGHRGIFQIIPRSFYPSGKYVLIAAHSEQFLVKPLKIRRTQIDLGGKLIDGSKLSRAVVYFRPKPCKSRTVRICSLGRASAAAAVSEL